MEFGIVLQTTPPSARVVDLAKRAETYGFSYVWTFDSHILWQEPYVIYSQILAETRNVIVGPMVTNPATRDWTVTASVYATLNEMFGNRTVCGIGRGDSAVRVTNGAPTTLATLRDAVHVIRELAQSRPFRLAIDMPSGIRKHSLRATIPRLCNEPRLNAELSPFYERLQRRGAAILLTLLLEGLLVLLLLSLAVEPEGTRETATRLTTFSNSQAI